MKTVHALALVAGIAMTACAGERNREVAVSDSLSRDLELGGRTDSEPGRGGHARHAADAGVAGAGHARVALTGRTLVLATP